MTLAEALAAQSTLLLWVGFVGAMVAIPGVAIAPDNQRKPWWFALAFFVLLILAAVAGYSATFWINLNPTR